MINDLRGKAVLITGGTMGIGWQRRCRSRAGCRGLDDTPLGLSRRRRHLQAVRR